LNETERDVRLLSTSYLDLLPKENDKKIICNIHRAYWQLDRTFQLKNINFTAQLGDLICIIGPIGSGKVCYSFS